MIMNGQRSGSIWTGKLNVYRVRTIISGLSEWMGKEEKRERLISIYYRQLLYLSKGFGSYQAKYTEMDSQRSAQTVLNNNNGRDIVVKIYINEIRAQRETRWTSRFGWWRPGRRRSWLSWLSQWWSRWWFWWQFRWGWRRWRWVWHCPGRVQWRCGWRNEHYHVIDPELVEIERSTTGWRWYFRRKSFSFISCLFTQKNDRWSQPRQQSLMKPHTRKLSMTTCLSPRASTDHE